jgi:hypothetical protein
MNNASNMVVDDYSTVPNTFTGVATKSVTWYILKDSPRKP